MIDIIVFFISLRYIRYFMSQNPKKLKRFRKSLTVRQERTSKCQITFLTKLDEEYSEQERQINLIYDQTKRRRTSSSYKSISRQPTDMEFILTSLDCDFLNSIGMTLKISPEQDTAHFSDEIEICCARILSNNFQTRKPCVKYDFDYSKFLCTK